MGFIPIFLQVEGEPCLVVGGGEVALRKVEALVAAGASVTVISPVVTAALADVAAFREISVLQRAYRQGDMTGYRLVYAATDDRQLNQHLYEDATRLKIPINVADSPAFCSFIVPATIRRGRLQVAISTGGASPALARRVRERMESWLGEELEVLLEILAGARNWLKLNEKDATVRSRKLNALAASKLDEALRERDAQAADRIVAECLGREVGLADLGLVDFPAARPGPHAGGAEGNPGPDKRGA
jgi:precorrin-2 dehydrogenase